MSAPMGTDLWREQQRDSAPTAMDELYAEIAATLCLPVEAVDFDVAWDYAMGAAAEGACDVWPRWPASLYRHFAPAVGATGGYTIYGGGK